MKSYQSHKVVQAALILKVLVNRLGGATLTLENGPEGDEHYEVSPTYVRKHEPLAGGYLVRYSDGYESFSPAESFEGGYEPLEPVPETGVSDTLEVEGEVYEAHVKTGTAYLRPYVLGEELPPNCSISDADLEAGSPREGDMVAVNPHNFEDTYLVGQEFFERNYIPLSGNPEAGNISGYRKLDPGEKRAVNSIKEVERFVAQKLGALTERDGVDGRFIALARTNLQQGFMWAIRAVARPADPWK